LAAEVFVARVGEIADGDRRLVRAGELVVGVFLIRGRYYAYRNRCVHQGGPVCQGTILGKVQAVLAPDRHVVRERFSDDEIHLVCPWHGYEYDIETGACAADPRLYLTAYPVIERDGGIYVRV
jgi:nitrite reductase/ring-hydroxylating ferredoxin subunit